MTTNHYPYTTKAAKTLFYFQSEGSNGTFDMAIQFQDMGGNRFNLALGVVIDGEEIRDDIETNNGDFLKIMSTVVKAVFEFFEVHPFATIQIKADERRRLKIYNGIFQRKKVEFERHFKISGLVGKIRTQYAPNRFYDGFEIKLKQS